MGTHSRSHEVGRRRVAGVAVSVALIAAGLALASGPATAAPTADTPTAAAPTAPAAMHAPALLVEQAPASGSTISGTAPVVVRFSQHLAKRTPLPRLVPAVAGTWARPSATEAVFYVKGGLAPYSSLRLIIPGGAGGVVSTEGGHLAKSEVLDLTVGAPSFARVQQLLAQLGYLPLSWTATHPQTRTAANEYQDAFTTPAGRWSWRWSWARQSLAALWSAGRPNLVTTGALDTFTTQHGLAMSSTVTPMVWKDLLDAVLARRPVLSKVGYTYALASKSPEPETLTVWHNGAVLEQTLANTGLPGAATEDGTFPVYLKLASQYMQGTDLQGKPYKDYVQWINYFNGGDAVHEFQRASYGYPQSLGCVEIPYAPAEFIYPYMVLGTLVTVAG